MKLIITGEKNKLHGKVKLDGTKWRATETGFANVDPINISIISNGTFLRAILSTRWRSEIKPNPDRVPLRKGDTVRYAPGDLSVDI